MCTNVVHLALSWPCLMFFELYVPAIMHWMSLGPPHKMRTLLCSFIIDHGSRSHLQNFKMLLSCFPIDHDAKLHLHKMRTLLCSFQIDREPRTHLDNSRSLLCSFSIYHNPRPHPPNMSTFLIQLTYCVKLYCTLKHCVHSTQHWIAHNFKKLVSHP